MMRLKKDSGISVILAVLFLPLICFLCGVGLTGYGIYQTVTDETKGFQSTTGYYDGKILESEGGYDAHKQTHSAPTYKLFYIYTVDGEEYRIKTDYSTSFVPDYGTPTEILYNPQNPEQAKVGGPNKENRMLIFMGIFFLFGSSVFLIPIGKALLPEKPKQKSRGKNSEKVKSKKKKRNIDWMLFYIGVFFVIIGYVILSMISGTYSLLGIVQYFKTSFIFPLLIPLVMMAGGCLAIYQAFFADRKSKNGKPKHKS